MTDQDPAPDAPEAAKTAEFNLDAALEAAFDKAQSEPDVDPEREALAKIERARDEQGRFAKAEVEKPAEAAKTEDQQPTDAIEPAKPVIDVPQSWSSEARQWWSQLSPDVQKYVRQREDEAHQAITRKGEQAAKWTDLDKVLTPYRERFRLNGVPEAQAVQKLLAAQDYLERDPINAMRWLAQSYGVNIDQMAQQPQTQVDPAIATLSRELHDLKQANAQRAKAEADAHAAAIASEISAFAKDKPHFEAVRTYMGALMQADASLTLQDAYDRAIHAHPTIRAQLQEEARTAAEAKRKEEAERVKAEAKKAAAVNVRGRMAPHSPPAEDWTDTLKRSAEEIYARA